MQGHRVRRSPARPVIHLVLAIAMLVGTFPTAVVADHLPAPSSVAVAGSLQSELGCAGDWDPACPDTELSNLIGDVWKSTFSVPAGDWEYKVALNDTWDVSYPSGNIALSVGAVTDVSIYYSHVTHWVADSTNDRIVTAPGSFQSELGCAGDWDPGCLASWLQDPDGDDVYSFTTDAIPAGSYEGKAAISESWDENYGEGGVANGANIAFTVADGDTVTFSFDSPTNTLTIDSSPAGPPTGPTVALVGSLQDELGCPGDWQPECVATELTNVIGDVYRATFTIPAGDWEYKVALNDTWDVSHPADNVLLSVASRHRRHLLLLRRHHLGRRLGQRPDRHRRRQLPIRDRMPRRLAAVVSAELAPGPRWRRGLHLHHRRDSGRRLRGQGRHR